MCHWIGYTSIKALKQIEGLRIALGPRKRMEMNKDWLNHEAMNEKKGEIEGSVLGLWSSKTGSRNEGPRTVLGRRQSAKNEKRENCEAEGSLFGLRFVYRRVDRSDHT